MPRLPRKHIPLKVQCEVALRQLGEMWMDETLMDYHGHYGSLLSDRLKKLAELLGTTTDLLRLDHTIALENREKLISLPGGRTVRQVIVPAGGKVLLYFPDEHDPHYLCFREHHNHHIKTNVRGDGAQYPDRVLAKRERKRAKRQKTTKQVKRRLKGIWKRPKHLKMFHVKRQTPAGGYNWPKRKIPSRPFRSPQSGFSGRRLR